MRGLIRASSFSASATSATILTQALLPIFFAFSLRHWCSRPEPGDTSGHSALMSWRQACTMPGFARRSLLCCWSTASRADLQSTPFTSARCCVRHRMPRPESAKKSSSLGAHSGNVGCVICMLTKSPLHCLANGGLKRMSLARNSSSSTSFWRQPASMEEWCMFFSMQVATCSPLPSSTPWQKRFRARPHSVFIHFASLMSSVAICAYSISTSRQGTVRFLRCFSRHLCTSPWPSPSTSGQRAWTSPPHVLLAVGSFSMFARRCAALVMSTALHGKLLTSSRFPMRHPIMAPSLPKGSASARATSTAQSWAASSLQCCARL
mmetsp:Transcript_104447/g.304883  ORF Transcript_104447/g.304883 Transcript_104447/m.304883 type:complete len:321 (-) Transcript_104447:1907-2869(-)